MIQQEGLNKYNPHERMTTFFISIYRYKSTSLPNYTDNFSANYRNVQFNTSPNFYVYQLLSSSATDLQALVQKIMQ